MSELAVISGELLDVRTYGNWGLGKMLSENSVLTICGQPLVGLEVDHKRRDRNQYRFTGSWKAHPKFGKQFEVTGISINVEPSYDALLKFLVRHYQGCGVRTADKIIQWYAANGKLGDLRDILICQPENLTLQPVLSKKKVPLVYVDDSGATMETQVYRRLAVQLGGYGLSDPLLRRMGAYLHAKVLGTEAAKTGAVEAAWQELRRDCYSLILRVEGYGFLTAEMIGEVFGVPKDAPERLAAIAHFVLEEASKGKGHTFLSRTEYREGVAAIDPAANFDNALAHAAVRGLPLEHDGDRYYLEPMLRAENNVAGRLARMARPHFAPIYAGSDAFLEHAINVAEQETDVNFRLDTSQRAALKSILTSRFLLHTLTAGPGCGKTKIMEVLCSVVQQVSVCFLAPTGKAAKVLHSRVVPYGREAMTIHRALEPSTTGFQRNAGNPLQFRVIVVDESSMVDLPLAADLLDATPDETHLVLVGDMDQLPSVGPGRLLEDAVLLPGDHNRLTTTHRNKGGILALVHRVREGVLADDHAEDVHFMGDMGEAQTGFDEHVLPAYLAAVARAGLPGVSLIMPRRKGKRENPSWNVTYANARLQDCLNPEVESNGGASPLVRKKVGHKVPDAPYFRVGDRVMVRKNLLIPARDPHADPGVDPTPVGRQYAVGEDADESEDDAKGGTVAGAKEAPIAYDSVVNGDVGNLVAAYCSGHGSLKALLLELDDGRSILFPAAFVDYLTLAYATTVHAAQGSEYKEVVLILNNGHVDFLHRRIVYTAVSRARERLTVFGAFWVMQKLVARPGPDRNSNLVAKVRAVLPPAEVAAAAAKHAAQPVPSRAAAFTSPALCVESEQSIPAAPPLAQLTGKPTARPVAWIAAAGAGSALTRPVGPSGFDMDADVPM